MKNWVIEKQTFSGLGEKLKELCPTPTSVFLLSDSQVYPLYGRLVEEELVSAKLLVHRAIIPSGERCKSIEQAHYCWKKMIEWGVDRRGLVISLGGGVTSDLAGFVAGCYMRGIGVAHLPTSLLGMVDASIGGKTGVNISKGKNMVGLFHEPKLIWCNLSCLKSLPTRELRAGMAEIVKYGVVWDALFFFHLEQHLSKILGLNLCEIRNIVVRSAEIKTEIINRDPRDQKLRQILNFGHTFAHAIEGSTDYAVYRHGEAVAVGMVLAARLAEQLGRGSSTLTDRLIKLCKRVGLPTILENGFDPQSLIDIMRRDKKTTEGSFTFILPKALGKVERVRGVQKETILAVLSGSA